MWLRSALLKCGSGSRLLLMRMWIQLFTLMQIRIRILIKVRGICDYWTVELQGLYFKPSPFVSVHIPPRLFFEPLNLLNVDFNADLYAAFHSIADPDPKPASKNSADPQSWWSVYTSWKKLCESSEDSRPLKNGKYECGLSCMILFGLMETKRQN